jgi:hypothetical protein
MNVLRLTTNRLKFIRDFTVSAAGDLASDRGNVSESESVSSAPVAAGAKKSASETVSDCESESVPSETSDCRAIQSLQILL